MEQFLYAIIYGVAHTAGVCASGWYKSPNPDRSDFYVSWYAGRSDRDTGMFQLKNSFKNCLFLKFKKKVINSLLDTIPLSARRRWKGALDLNFLLIIFHTDCQKHPSLKHVI